ncbi:MAG: septal ring lytic transglycosylase RlpA family protein [Solirubrobacterales bacterium]
MAGLACVAVLGVSASAAQAQSGGTPGSTSTAPTTTPAPAAGSWTLIQKATWYGPGFWGKRTACGTKLSKKTLGVAHRKLPCGTQVTFDHNGVSVTTTVIDRGPFRKGYKWDLTRATAKAIDFLSVGSGPLTATVTPVVSTYRAGAKKKR